MLFSHLPENLFSILASPKNKKVNAEALFVVREAFKSELIIKRGDLAAMLIDALEDYLQTMELDEDEEQYVETPGDISGKAYLLIRRLLDTGWIETEYERNSFEENITVPDYSIKIINLLYELAHEEQREYNSYVFATYSSLKSSLETPEYRFQALSSAYRNTVALLDELKSLFNNIKRYHNRITDEVGINALLVEHFDIYKEKIIDNIYYPLKTIDSVPRFKNQIIRILNEWALSDEVLIGISRQGVKSRIYQAEPEGRSDVQEKINFIIETYETLEELINSIDEKHIQYTNVSVDKIRYILNADRSMKGKLVCLLKRSKEDEVLKELAGHVEFYQHTYLDERSLYEQLKRSKKKEGTPLAIEIYESSEKQLDGFLDEIRRQYSNKKIDDYIAECFRGRQQFEITELEIGSTQDFIFAMLGTIRGTEHGAPYRVVFQKGQYESGGYRMAKVTFLRKGTGGADNEV